MQYPSPRQPLAVKAINRVAQALGVERPLLDADKLLETARKQTGLQDFGDTDLRPNLLRLVAAMNDEARLSVIGRIGVRAMLLDNLCLRLRLVDYRHQRAAVREQRIEKPLFLMGLPRTGTTILYELLAQDPAHRAPISWEVSQPLPPARAESFGTDPRIAQVEKQLSKIETLAPGFQAIHEIGALLPQECVSLLAPHFISDQFGATYFIPQWRRWSLDQDMQSAYRWHRQFLQHLQVDYMRERWVLKTPAHLPYLDAISAVYPDAVFVQTHREPMEVLGSVSSLACTLHSAFSDTIDPVETGRAEAAHFADVLQRGMRQRDAMADESRFFDIQFKDILEDPISRIEALYAHFGFTFTDQTAQRMKNYLANRPRDKHGRHRYRLEDYGLSWETHGEWFTEYRKRFPIEASK